MGMRTVGLLMVVVGAVLSGFAWYYTMPALLYDARDI